jgi:hypothetical protein
MPAATPGAIAVIVTSVDDQSSRAEAAENVTIGIVVIGSVGSESAASADSWDDFAESLRDYLRQNAAAKHITTGSLTAQRRTLAVPTVADADMLSESEVFVAVIECTYFCTIGGRA